MCIARSSGVSRPAPAAGEVVAGGVVGAVASMFAALYVNACHVSNLAKKLPNLTHKNVRSRANQKQSHDVLLRILNFEAGPKLN